MNAKLQAPALARARMSSVLGVLLMGAIGLIASTQSWYFVELHEVTEHPLEVAGAAALPVLAPLSLAAMALAAALAIVGPVLRIVFGFLTLAIGVVLIAMTAPLAFAAPITAVASTVTEATFISGNESIGALIAQITSTAWAPITLGAAAVLALFGIFIVVSARHWRRSGRRFAASDASAPRSAGPVDAIDGWDGLSKGIDPTDIDDVNTPPPAR